MAKKIKVVTVVPDQNDCLYVIDSQGRLWVRGRGSIDGDRWVDGSWHPVVLPDDPTEDDPMEPEGPRTAENIVGYIKALETNVGIVTMTNSAGEKYCLLPGQVQPLLSAYAGDTVEFLIPPND